MLRHGFAWRLLCGAVCLALAWFYVTAALEHGRRINLSKARGDQSGYLWDAENVYFNWHGRQPLMPIGERNRMPLYAAYLSLFYHQGLSDPDFFVVAKRANVYLSVALLIVLWLTLRRELPPHAAVNLTGIAAFGYFIFKAAYSQSELLFYALFFLAFLGCWHLFRTAAGWRMLALAAVTGALAALAYLTKAAATPLLVIFLAAFVGEALERAVFAAPLTRREMRLMLSWRAAAALVLVAAYFGVLSPYLATNKRMFGTYFYNVNSMYYAWYDDWASASVNIERLGNGVTPPNMPQAEVPSAWHYWQQHRVPEIAARVTAGFENMALVSYTTYNILWYGLLFLAAAVVLLVTRGRAIRSMIAARPGLAMFVALYALFYAVATAFYYPISGTGTARFLLTHVLPLLFVLSWVLSKSRVSAVRWQVGPMVVRTSHFHALISFVLVYDILFRVWPRLMTTYGGF